jgi:aminoglycoside phosphotransferase (APT) family kinase protein
MPFGQRASIPAANSLNKDNIKKPSNIAPVSLENALQAFVCDMSHDAWTVRITKRYVGGFSWLTYGFTLIPSHPSAGGKERELILRLGHAEGLLSPYSTIPEFLVLSSLVTSALPVPRVLWHSDDPSILGAPFLIVEKVGGSANPPFGRDATVDLESTRRIGEQFVQMLAALHNFDWHSSPTKDLQANVAPDRVALAQVHRWEQMIQESAIAPPALLHRALRWLKDRAPAAPRVSIVHGDYRAGNFLQEGDRITAILDWELVHLGDPHEDISWASMKFLSGGQDLVCGLIARDVFMQRYQASTGIEISSDSLRFYDVLALVKVCAMNLRAASRVERGEATDVRMATLAFGLPRQIAEINRMIKEAR